MVTNKTQLSFLVAILLSCVGLAMQPHEADRTSASSLQEDDGLSFLLQFAHAAAELDIDRYLGLIIGLKKLDGNRAHYKNLFEVLTKTKKTTQGLELKLWASSDLAVDSSQQWLFHGTNATREIFNAKELKAFTAQCGRWGIFFGRNFSDSYTYSSSRSSTINHTWLTKTPSVLVLKKDPNLYFESSSAGAGGTVKEYLLRQNAYSLSNLKAIFLRDEKDAEAIEEKLLNNTLPKFDVYVENYHPLSVAENLSALKKVLHDHQEQLLSDSGILACFAKVFPEIFFGQKHVVNKILNSIKNSDSQDLHTLLIAAMGTKSHASLEILLSRLKPEDILVGDCFDSFFATTLNEGDLESLRKVLEHISPVLPKAADTIATLWSNFSITTTDQEKLSLLATTFYDFPEVQKIVLILHLKQKNIDKNFFTNVLKRALPVIRAENGKGYVLAHEVAKARTYELLRIIAQHAPELISFVNSDSKTILHYLAGDKEALETFNFVLDISPKLLKHLDRHKLSVAHVAAENNNLEVLKVVAEKAPDLFCQLDNNQRTPLDIGEHLKTHFPKYETFKNQ